MVMPKNTKNTQGVQVMTLKAKNTVESAAALKDGDYVKPHAYKTKNIPAAGSFLKDEDKEARQLQIRQLN